MTDPDACPDCWIYRRCQAHKHLPLPPAQPAEAAWLPCRLCRDACPVAWRDGRCGRCGRHTQPAETARLACPVCGGARPIEWHDGRCGRCTQPLPDEDGGQ